MNSKENIQLFPLCTKDSNLVYSIYNDKDVTDSALLTYTLPLSDKIINEKVEDWLGSIFQKHYVINVNNENIGLAQIYNICYLNRKCNLGILLFKEHWGLGFGSLILEKLINISFNHLNLHKIECEALVGNSKSLKILTNAGFVQEGILKQSVFKNGEYQDILLFGLIKGMENNE